MQNIRKDWLMLKWKNTAKIMITVLILNLSIVGIAILPTMIVTADTVLATDMPVVYIDPQNVNVEPGENFTISVKIFNLTDTIYASNFAWTPGQLLPSPDSLHIYTLGNLYGLDIELSWDPSILDYASHTVKIPNGTSNPDGILYEPILDIMDYVDSSAGTYRLAKSSQSPAPAFNCPDANATVFTMTFNVTRRGACALDLTSVELVAPSDMLVVNGGPINKLAIPHWVLNSTFSTSSEEATVIRTIPETAELGPERVVGQTFAVAVVVENVADLAGLDIQFSWNTTYFEYVNHTLTATVESFPSPVSPSPYPGILHDPPLLLKDEVNATAGTYWAAFATLGGPSFNGSGTAFVMTFRIACQPLVGEEDVNLSLHFISTVLARSYGGSIPHDVFDGTVIIHAGAVRDIGIVNVTTSKAGCLPLETVGQGYNMTIYTTVENQGDFTETFNITAYANTTTIWKQLVTLNPGDNQTLAFTWDTIGFAYGKYTINVTADVVLGETDITDNTMTYPRYTLVTIPGDIDGDRDVNIFDIVRMAGIYGTTEEDPQYDPNCDIDGDGDIDIYDIVAAAANYSKSW